MSKAAVKLDVADVVAAQVDVHQARDELVRGGVLVELDALHQGRGAVAHADDGYVDGVAHGRSPHDRSVLVTQTSFVFLHETTISVKSRPMGRPLIAYLRVAPRERAGGAARASTSSARALASAAARARVGARGASRRTSARAAPCGARACGPPWPRAGPARPRASRSRASTGSPTRSTDLAELVREAMDGGFTIVSLQPDVRPVGRRRPRGGGGARRGGLVAAPVDHHRRRARSRGRPGRPSSTPPAVAARIRELRGQGMTLQAICDTLNADRIPTPRGGARVAPHLAAVGPAG